jgi:hypothetical protein
MPLARHARWLAILLLAGAAQAAEIPSLPPATVEPPAAEAGRAEIQLHGYVQSDAVAWAQSSEDQLAPVTGEPLNQERLLVRRARLELDVRKGPLLGLLELDGNTVRGPSVGLTAAEVSLLLARQPPAREDLVVASLGLSRIPFGSELQERERDRLFFDRSNVSRALFPGAFDLALRLQARWRSLVVQFAVMNGEPLASGTFAGRDPTAAKDLAGRLGLARRLGSLRVDAGLSVLEGKGFHPGTPATKDVLVWRDQNEDGIVQTSELQIIPGSPASPSATFHRFALGCDLRVRADLPGLGTATASAEVVWAGNLDRGLLPADPVSSGRDLRELGFVLGLTQEIGPHGFLGARYDWYSADLDAAQAVPLRVVPVSAEYSTLALLAGWRFADLDRVAVELDVNRNPNGRSDAGLPANLPANTLTLRAQLGF